MCSCKGGGCAKVKQVYHALEVFVKALRVIQKTGIPHVKKLADALEDALTCELVEEDNNEEK